MVYVMFQKKEITLCLSHTVCVLCCIWSKFLGLAWISPQSFLRCWQDWLSQHLHTDFFFTKDPEVLSWLNLLKLTKQQQNCLLLKGISHILYLFSFSISHSALQMSNKTNKQKKSMNLLIYLGSTVNTLYCACEYTIVCTALQCLPFFLTVMDIS